jgi:hypothetical protein
MLTSPPFSVFDVPIKSKKEKIPLTVAATSILQWVPTLEHEATDIRLSYDGRNHQQLTNN